MLERDVRCRGCDYPLKGIPSGECPECGRPFDWNKRTTYKEGDEPGFAGTHLRPRLIRGLILLGLFLVGVVLLLVPWNDFSCCFFSTVYPMWLMVCTILILAMISVDGRIPLVLALPLGVVIAMVLGLTAGWYGLAVGAAAGLLGGLVYKQLEMNNML